MTRPKQPPRLCRRRRSRNLQKSAATTPAHAAAARNTKSVAAIGTGEQPLARHHTKNSAPKMAAKERRELKEGEGIKKSRWRLFRSSRDRAGLRGADSLVRALIGSLFSRGQSGPHACGFGESSVCSLRSLAASLAAVCKSAIANRK